MERENLRTILRGKCISDQACEAAIDDLLISQILIPHGFYVMTPNGEDWEQLSIVFKTKKEAEMFKDSNLNNDPYCVIMCRI